MKESDIKRYVALNKLAEPDGIVIFGGSGDMHIPLGELEQAFSVEAKIYNRSFEELSVKEALSIYEKYVAPLAPETVFLHIGEADTDFFNEESILFDNKYRELITYIKAQNKKCRIVVVSLKNYKGDPRINEMNRHLKYIADSERCEYSDIENKKVWNPRSTMDVTSFMHTIGFVHPLKCKSPLYDLVKILFCYEA